MREHAPLARNNKQIPNNSRRFRASFAHSPGTMKTPLLFLAALCSAQLALAAPTPIAGIVRDGTQGNAPLPNAPVQLIRPGDNGAKKVLQTVMTDATGRFLFPAQEWGKDDLLMANVPHQGYDYAAVAYDGGDKLKAVGMTVNPLQVDVSAYDTTTKDVKLRIPGAPSGDQIDRNRPQRHRAHRGD